jgi:hypothetical protein
MLSIVPKFSLPQPHRLSITHFGSNRENSLGKIPDNSRLIGKSVPVGFSQNGSKHYRQTLYVIWDKAQGVFKLFEKFLWLDYTDENKYRQSRGSDHEATLNHGDVLGADFIPGTIVDQVNQKLILPDGRQIDGPTGDILDVHGRRILARDPEVHQKLRESEKEC